jgi:hypothetical protein
VRADDRNTSRIVRQPTKTDVAEVEGHVYAFVAAAVFGQSRGT